MSPTLEWNRLESDTREGRGQVQRKVLSDSPLNLYVALERPSGNRVMFWDMPVAGTSELAALPGTRGISLSVTHDADLERATVRLVTTDPGFNELFGWLAEDLVTAAERGNTTEEATQQLLKRLTEWRLLLERAASDVISREAQRGLFGELLVLRDIVLPMLPKMDAVDGWTGPLLAPQDFQFSRIAIEVKSSGSANRQLVRVNGEYQLDAGHGVTVWLVVVWLDERIAGGEETLPGLVDAVRNVLSDNLQALELFERKLQLLGYSDDHRGSYEERSYWVRDIQAFEAGERFPRFLPEMLPTGISNVAYDVSVAACAPFERSLEEIATALNGEVE